MHPSLVRTLVASFLWTGCLASPGCSAATPDNASPDAPAYLSVSCEGKCDGWGSIESLWQDAGTLDLGDLLAVGAGLATDELNQKLAACTYASIKLGETKLYSTADRAANDLTVGNLDKLTSGLAVVYGERELTTRVNRLRRDHLLTSQDAYYGEFAFRLGSDLGHSWNLPAAGFDASASVGFDANATLTARVIGAFPSEVGARGVAPLKALQAVRSFVVPRTLDDLRTMKPGELVALSGSGALGLNVGVGVPMLVASPASWVNYNVVASAALRTRLQGQLDVQLVRLDGDQVVVDVGVQDARVAEASIALQDGWGAQGLLKSVVDIGGVQVDLRRLMQSALLGQTNARLQVLSARAQATGSSSRMSVARIRFMLDAGDPQRVGKALAHASRGDVRLAQALSAKGEPGVAVEFDLSRSGMAATSHAGIDIFGMSFFHDVEEDSGSVVMQTPGGVRSLLFDSLHKESGWFHSSHGYTRVGLSGLLFDPADPAVPATGEANLFLQLEHGSDRLSREVLLDHLDALIVGLGGEGALDAIEGPGNELQRFVTAACPWSTPYDPCRTAVLDDPEVVKLRSDAESGLEAALSHLEPDARALVMQAGRLRIASQASVEPNGPDKGPPSSVVFDLRLDDATLGGLLTSGREYAFRSSAVRFLRAARVNRQANPDQIAAERASIPTSRDQQALDAMAAEYKDHALGYQKLLAAERAIIENIGAVGPRTLEIRFPVDGANRPVYERASASSLSHARSRIATQLFDELVRRAGGLDLPAEQLVIYTLLGMTPAAQTEVRLNVDMDFTTKWAADNAHFQAAGQGPFDAYARGSELQPIDGGLFDLDSLVNLQ